MLPDDALQKFWSEGNDGIPPIALVVTIATGHYRYAIQTGLEKFLKLSSIISYKYSESILAITKRGKFL